MAPAVRVDTFTDKVLPAIKDGAQRYHQSHLADAAEQKPRAVNRYWLRPLAALPRLAIVRAGQDYADTRHGKIFRREATGAAQRARLGRAVQGIAKRRTWRL
ncbi:MAG: hypothetical protein IPN81_11455 [Nitrosomonadales bacterium]|nr:hypothetical protein [Nitrosomonadales bacterium]